MPLRSRHLAFIAVVAAGLAAILAVACEKLPVSETSGESQPATARLELKTRLAPVRFVSPLRIALGEAGQLFISDFKTESVIELETAGSALHAVAAFELSGPPLGVAWAQNRLYVGNAATGSVDVYSTVTGVWLRQLGGVGAFQEPRDIAIDSRAGRVFVLDAGARTIRSFAIRGWAERTAISKPVLDESDLQNPTGITIDPRRRELLVSDYGDLSAFSPSASIKIFSYEGALVGSISGAQRFSRPQGLALDARGRILVADAVAGEVVVLDRASGAVVETLGELGDGPGQLRLPLDVAVGGDGHVLVTSNRTGRVEVFSRGRAAR